MLFTQSGVAPGGTVLVQGAGGGVATGADRARRVRAGYRVWVTSRDEDKRARALELGADAAFEPGARLPERVDAVMETVGAATWSHSLKSLRPGGTLVVAGATSGANPPGRAQPGLLPPAARSSARRWAPATSCDRLLRFCEMTGVRPLVDSVLPIAPARDGFARMADGQRLRQARPDPLTR